ncbi:7104_t:CDS:1, partial [Scutellospora calospora]
KIIEGNFVFSANPIFVLVTSTPPYPQALRYFSGLACWDSSQSKIVGRESCQIASFELRPVWMTVAMKEWPIGTTANNCI